MSLPSFMVDGTVSLLAWLKTLGQQQKQTLCNFTVTALPATFVVASIKSDDTAWVKNFKLHSGDDTVIYVGDNITAKHHSPTNKGRESMQYLSYLIDHYHSLPKLMIFIHANRGGWHNNFLFGGDLQRMLSHLHRTHVMERGFVNVRCDWLRGCPTFIQMNNSDSSHDDLTTQRFKSAYRELFPGQSPPDQLAVPGGGQFALTAEVVHRVSLDRLIFIRNWLINTEMESYQAGQILEFSWHLIFLGPSASMLCPEESLCYCQLYGLCLSLDLGGGIVRSVGAVLADLKRLEETKNDVKLKRAILKDEIDDDGSDASEKSIARLRSLDEELHSIEREFDVIMTAVMQSSSRDSKNSLCSDIG